MNKTILYLILLVMFPIAMANLNPIEEGLYQEDYWIDSCDLTDDFVGQNCSTMSDNNLNSGLDLDNFESGDIFVNATIPFNYSILANVTFISRVQRGVFDLYCKNTTDNYKLLAHIQNPADGNYSHSIFNSSNPCMIIDNSLVLHIYREIEIFPGPERAYTNESWIYWQTYKNNSLDDCSNNGIETLGIDIYNENSINSHLVADLDIFATLSSFTEVIVPTNITLNLSNYANYTLCLNNSDNAVVDLYIKNKASYTHRYYYINETLSDVVTNISLYNFNSTSGISDLWGIIRVDDTYSYFPGVISTLQRKYVSLPNEGWLTVQMDESDSYGQIYFHVIEQEEDYRIIFMDKETKTVLSSTDSIKFACDSGVCVVTFLVPSLTGSSGTPNLVVNSSYNNVTQIITVNWTDPTNRTSSVRLLGSVENPGYTNIVCDDTYYNHSGGAICNMSGLSGTFMVRVYSSASPEKPFYSKFYSAIADSLADVLKNQGLNAESALWSAGIIVVATGAGIALGPLVTLGLGIAAILVLIWLGISPVLTISTFILIAAVTVIIALRTRNREE